MTGFNGVSLSTPYMIRLEARIPGTRKWFIPEEFFPLLSVADSKDERGERVPLIIMPYNLSNYQSDLATVDQSAKFMIGALYNRYRSEPQELEWRIKDYAGWPPRSFEPGKKGNWSAVFCGGGGTTNIGEWVQHIHGYHNYMIQHHPEIIRWR